MSLTTPNHPQSPPQKPSLTFRQTAASTVASTYRKTRLDSTAFGWWLLAFDAVIAVLWCVR
jgi:hypothetical protein